MDFLDLTCKECKYAKHHLSFKHFLPFHNLILWGNCSNIFGLFNEIGIDHKILDWRLFIGSSVKCLKAELLHNHNKFPTISGGHFGHMTEGYENVKSLSDMIKHTSHNWNVYGDFKMLASLPSQIGCTKYLCLFCFTMIIIIQESSGHSEN